MSSSPNGRRALTFVRWAWMFNFNYTTELLFVQVIWVIGVAMIVLAGLVHLPLGAVAAVGIAMIPGHNLLDGVTPEWLGDWGPLWILCTCRPPSRSRAAGRSS